MQHTGQQPFASQLPGGMGIPQLPAYRTTTDNYPATTLEERSRTLHGEKVAPMLRCARDGDPDFPERVFRPRRFNGQNPDAWINKMELYLLGAGVPEHRKLLYALSCFEDECLDWYNYSLGPSAPRDWEGLKFMMRKHYNAVSQNEARARLAAVKHTHTIQEYLERFNKALARCWDMSEQEKTRAFIRGLRPEWRMAIAGNEPTHMVDAINKAVAMEEIWFEAGGSSRRKSKWDKSPRKTKSRRHWRSSSTSSSPRYYRYGRNSYRDRRREERKKREDSRPPTLRRDSSAGRGDKEEDHRREKRDYSSGSSRWRSGSERGGSSDYSSKERRGSSSRDTGRRHDRSGSRKREREEGSKGEQKKNDNRCYICGKVGHWSAECPEKRSN